MQTVIEFCIIVDSFFSLQKTSQKELKEKERNI